MNMNNIDELKKKLGRKWRINLFQLYIMCKYFRRHYDKKLRISTRSYRLCEKLGCEVARFARIIKLAVDVGLLKVSDDKYAFNCVHSGDNQCRLYEFNKELADDIYGFTNSILMERINKEREKKLYIKKDKGFNCYDKDNKEIRPCELPEITCRKRYERGMLPWIYERYPQINDVQTMISELNTRLTEEDHWFYSYMIPNAREKEPDQYTFSCRATSEICNMKKHSVNPNELVRDDILNDYFGKDKWEEYDLNASIYRIARSCRDGAWYDDNGDIYELFHGGKFTSDEERKAFKDLCMIVAFSKDLYSAYMSYKNAFDKYTMKYQEVLPIIEPLLNNIKDFCGEVDTDIFLHESYIMTSLAHDLYKRGIKVVQLYDCLFVPKGTARYLNSMISNVFLYYYRTYII